MGELDIGFSRLCAFCYELVFVTLPKSLPPAQVEQVLAHCDRSTSVGRRNYAILLLLARLGLRAGEVVNLTLDDIHWETGRLTIRGKMSRVDQLPLPADVGEAIVAYLKNGWPPVLDNRRLFLRAKAPLRGLKGPQALSTIVRRALERAGIESTRKGAHLFRHTLASEMFAARSFAERDWRDPTPSKPRDNRHLRESRYSHPSIPCVTLARRLPMNQLKKAVMDYVEMRRSLGYKLQMAPRLLSDFVTFLEEQGTDHITIPLALQWAQQNSSASPAEWAQRLTYVRGFARYWSAFDPRTQIPPWGLLPHNPKRARPYLYTEEEIQRLLKAARELGGFRGLTYYSLFGVLTVTGLRISEALNLHTEDVDLSQGILGIRRTKFDKSRWVPIHASTQKVLREYVQEKRSKISSRFILFLCLSNRESLGQRRD